MEKLYQLRNAECITYLILKGFKIEEKEVEKGIVYCYFRDTPELRKSKDDFYNDENLQSFIKQLRELKKEFYELKTTAAD